MTDVTDILDVREKCFEDELSWLRSSCSLAQGSRIGPVWLQLYLGKNQAAVESAWKAGNTQCKK